MKKIISIVVFVCATLMSFAQIETWYVAAKAGLSIRETPSASAKVLDKIPYGEKIIVNLGNDTAESKKIATEGFNGTWIKTSFKGKNGYVVSSYLLPMPPPKATTKTLKDYLAQVSSPAGAPLVIKKVLTEDYNSTLKKQLYKNGCELHDYSAYEYGSETFFLPDFGIEQGYLLLRLLKAFPDVIGENDAFPQSNSTKKLKNGEKRVTVQKISAGAAETYVEKIKIEWEDGAVYEMHLYMLDSQLVIFSSGGV